MKGQPLSTHWSISVWLFFLITARSASTSVQKLSPTLDLVDRERLREGAPSLSSVVVAVD